MRVTTQSMTKNFIFNLNKHLTKINRFQNEISSGKKINKPSDNPTGTSTVLGLRSTIQKNEQYIRNIEDGLLNLNMAEDTLYDTQNLISRAKDIAISAGNGTLNADDRQNFAVEVNGLIEQLLMDANQTSLDGYLFGGSQTESYPFEPVRNGAGEITSVSMYGDVSGEILRVVGEGQPVKVNTDSDGFFYGDQNLFQSLIQLREALRTNSIDDISNELGKLNDFYDDAISKVSEIGVKVGFLENRRDTLDVESLNLLERMSEIEDTDIVESILYLEQEQLAYQAALSVGSQLLNSSILNYFE